jgi:TetR/AcrR family acrAB operon transcriptional repressor
MFHEREDNMVRKTKEEAEQTRRALLSAALKVFSRQGYAATRLEDIAEEAGVTRGAIYWHFKSKADLYIELQGRAAGKLMALVEAEFVCGGKALDILRRIMVRSWQYLEEDEEFRAVQELAILKTELLPELSEGMRAKIEGINSQMDQVEAVFSQAQAEGDFAPEISPRDAALGYTAMLNGMVINWLLAPHTFSIRDRAEAMADLFFRSLRP